MAKSIKEIAQELNVSKSTVSLVINHKAEQARISKELERRVLDYVEKVGYKPNSLAKSLATGRSNTIGLIVENIGDSFFGPFALHVEELLRKKNYHVLYSSTLGDPQNAQDIIDFMLEKKVEGILLAPTVNLEEHQRKILENKVPLVVFDRNSPEVATHYVHIDNGDSSRKACLHLQSIGCKNFGLITIDSDQPQMLARKNAYLQFCEETGMQARILQLPYNRLRQKGIAALRSWVSKNVDLDGLFFTTNYLCILGLKSLRSEGGEHFNFPLFSFDDHELFDILNPKISCIQQPLEPLAKTCVKVLLKEIDSGITSPKEYVISTNLIKR
ncbi:LacI family DNA-binding transcriptional regulator [Sphingobacterium detergens]|uniref:LacI family transcriptional regulator n=1 Tax=Sphingobacterium detergens TaxID=1145106 RepID=A0A420AG70_SPHD1|nr:LacI family DNA-binding transcriptional regulator [Sphingobacterium detergens]RKE43528.1 LacI family transcriptional regulator [Sphingobacterium detergens]